MKNRKVGITSIYDKEAMIKNKNMNEFPMGMGRAHPDPFYLGGLKYYSSVAFPNVSQTYGLIPNNAFVGYGNTNENVEPHLKETTGQALPYPPAPEISEPIKIKKAKEQKYQSSIKPVMRTKMDKPLASIKMVKKNKRILATDSDYYNDIRTKMMDKMRMALIGRVDKEKKEKKERKYEIKI